MERKVIPKAHQEETGGKVTLIFLSKIKYLFIIIDRVRFTSFAQFITLISDKRQLYFVQGRFIIENPDVCCYVSMFYTHYVISHVHKEKET